MTFFIVYTCVLIVVTSPLWLPAIIHNAMWYFESREVGMPFLEYRRLEKQHLKEVWEGIDKRCRKWRKERAEQWKQEHRSQ